MSTDQNPMNDTPRSTNMTDHLHGITQQLYRLESLNEHLNGIASRVAFFTTGQGGTTGDVPKDREKKQPTLSLHAIQENLMRELDRAEKTIAELNESLGDGDIRKAETEHERR